MQPVHMPPTSSAHDSSHQIYIPVLSQGVSTAPVGYSPHSQSPFPLPRTQVTSTSLQPSAYHPIYVDPYQFQHVTQQPVQQSQPQYLTSRPPPHAPQFTGIPPGPSFSAPVAPVQQALRYPSRVEGPSFPYFIQNYPHEFIMLKMAFTNLLQDEPELYKFHIILDHLHLPSARHIALSYAHDPRPFSMALAALE